MKSMIPDLEQQKTVSFDDAYDRYEQIRDRLPPAVPHLPVRRAASLLETTDNYDGYLFDSFGVLNVGETAIAGAAECLHELRRRNKPFCILTNAASYTSAQAFDKYRKLGLDVSQNEILSSRDVLFSHVNKLFPGCRWGAIAAKEDTFSDTVVDIAQFDDPAADWDGFDGILFLSAARWTDEKQERLIRFLRNRPRPVLVGNPDLVAPREGGLTVEPGYWSHDIQDRTGIEVHFFGKPYENAFQAAATRIGASRIAMIGDTLHTDILGGQAAGLDTVLVTDHGLFKARPVDSFIRQSGIAPTWIIPSI